MEVYLSILYWKHDILNANTFSNLRRKSFSHNTTKIGRVSESLHTLHTSKLIHTIDRIVVAPHIHI